MQEKVKRARALPCDHYRNVENLLVYASVQLSVFLSAFERARRVSLSSSSLNSLLKFPLH